MVLFPAFNWLALTVSDDVAVPSEPEGWAPPRNVPPAVNATDPTGEMLPLAAFTVAVSTVLPLAEMPMGLAVTVVGVPMAGMLLHCVTRLYASTGPSPVARSSPAAAR